MLGQKFNKVIKMDQTLIYIFALVLVSFILLFVGLFVMYLRLLRKYDELRRLPDEEINPEILVDRARQRSQQILEDAHTKSRQMLANTEKYLVSEDSQMSKVLEKVGNVYTTKYEEAIGNSKAKAEQMIQNIPQDIKLTLVSALDSFRISLSQEVNKAQAEANKAIKEAYEKAAAEVNNYKEERMRQVDNSILEIVKDVTEKVLAKSVSTEEHEKLVQKALEEAKRQKIF